MYAGHLRSSGQARQQTERESNNDASHDASKDTSKEADKEAGKDTEEKARLICVWHPSFKGERKGRELRVCHLRANGPSRQTGSQAKTQPAKKDAGKQAKSRARMQDTRHG